MSDYLKKIYPYAFLLLLLLIVIYLFEVLIPFAIAFIIAYLVNPLKIFFDKYLNKTFSSFLSVVFFILGFFSVLILIFPIIFYQLQNLIWYLSHRNMQYFQYQSILKINGHMFLWRQSEKNFYFFVSDLQQEIC